MSFINSSLGIDDDVVQRRNFNWRLGGVPSNNPMIPMSINFDGIAPGQGPYPLAPGNTYSDYYNGVAHDWGVTFGAGTWLLNHGNYSNNPSPPSIAIPWPTGAVDRFAIINRELGFTGMSFWYAVEFQIFEWFVYSEINGGGVLLGQGLCDQGSPGGETWDFWAFVSFSVPLNGPMAKSLLIGGFNAGGRMGIDSVELVGPAP